MRKLLYQFTLYALNALLIFSPALASCKNVAEDARINERTLYYAPTETQKKNKPLVPAPDLSSIWSVEDADVSRLDPSKKHVAFTFDDAPTKRLPELVDTFLQYNADNPDCVASATVFYNGVNLNEYTLPYVNKAYAADLELGNHTYSHCDLRTLTPSEVNREIELVDTFLKQIDGKPHHLLRAPYGAVDDKVRAAAKTPILDWSVDTLDWTGNSAQDICEKVLSGLERGGVVLFHDGAKNTIEAVSRLLPILKERGYQVVSVSQLSKIHTCPLRTGGLYTRARPNRS